MKLSAGDSVTYAGLIAVAVIQATDGVRKELAVPPDAHPFLGSSIWSYLPIAILTLVGLVWLVRQLRGRPLADSPAPAAPASGEAWLAKLVGNDDREMSSRLFPIPQSAHNEAHLDAPNPYVDLSLAFINASVFSVKPVEIEGRFKLRGYDLQAQPELFRSLDIAHGTHGGLVIRQWFTPETAKEILAAGQPTSLETGYVAVWFGYTNSAGEQRKARSSIGNECFVIL